MTKPILVMALENEGQGLPEQLGFPVLYCGVGKVNAAYFLTKRLVQARERGEAVPYVFNLGSAGSPRFPRDTLVAATRFIQRDMDATGIGFIRGETPFDPHPAVINFPERFPDMPHGTCASGDSFVQDDGSLGHCDLVDMEAYALAKVCLHEGIHFACVKYVTDGAGEGAGRDWQDNVRAAAHAFSQLLSTLPSV